MTPRMLTTREREQLFLRLADHADGTSAPEVYQQAIAEGDQVTKEAYQNLGRRLVHRGLLVADTAAHPTRFRRGQSVDGHWLEEEELATMVSDDYPLLALPIWQESLRQIQHVPEDWWALLRTKLSTEDALNLFESAITSYCENLDALVRTQVDALVNGGHAKDISRTREEGRNTLLLLQGLVRFGLGISREAVTLPDQFEQAVRALQTDLKAQPVAYDTAQLRAELSWRVERGPFIQPIAIATEPPLLVAAVDGSTRSGVMSFLGQEDDFYVGHAPMISINTAVGQVNRRLRIGEEELPVFTRLPEKPEDMQQRDNKYTIMAKLFFPDLSDAEYMHALWNGMDVLETRTTLRMLGRWYTSPAGTEIRPADLVIRDGTVVPQDRDFNHYKDSNRYGEIVRDMISINWDIAKKCKDDDQTVAGVIKNAQLRVLGPVLNWYVGQAAARHELGPIEAWPVQAMNDIPDQILLTRLLTAHRRKGDPWVRTCMVLRPFHATNNLGKTFSINRTPIDQITDRREKELQSASQDPFGADMAFWQDFRGAADPYVQMLRHVAYASCFIAAIPRLEVERYLPRVEFIVPTDVYATPDPGPLVQRHLQRICSGLAQTGFEVSAEHSMFRDVGTLEVIPALVARAHDTVKTWAQELLMRVDEYLAGIIGRHIQTKRSRGIRMRPFTRDELRMLHQSLEEERRRLGGGTSPRHKLDR